MTSQASTNAVSSSTSRVPATNTTVTAPSVSSAQSGPAEYPEPGLALAEVAGAVLALSTAVAVVLARRTIIFQS